MFPFDIEDDEIDLKIEESKAPSDYEIDFNTGKLTGKIITGLDAIKQWVRIVLLTDRYFYPQYSWDHGSELNSLIGQTYDSNLIKSEVKRMIQDALLISKDINSVDDIECEIDKDRLTVRFTIDTIYGRGEMIV